MTTNIPVDTSKTPIIVGVTGHRNVIKDDYPDICQEIRKFLGEIKDLCKTKNTPKQKPMCNYQKHTDYDTIHRIFASLNSQNRDICS